MSGWKVIRVDEAEQVEAALAPDLNSGKWKLDAAWSGPGHNREQHCLYLRRVESPKVEERPRESGECVVGERVSVPDSFVPVKRPRGRPPKVRPLPPDPFPGFAQEGGRHG